MRRLMRLLPVAAATLLAVTAGACVRPARPPVAPPASRLPRAADQLRAAEGLVRIGCYDCLVDALHAFQAVAHASGEGADAAAAGRAGVVRTALLLSVREVELGLLPGPYLELARQQLAAAAEVSPELPALVEIAGVLASGPAGFTRAATTDRQLAAVLTLSRSQERWATVLRNLMPQDLTASYLWLALACGPSGYSFPDHERRQDVLGPTADLPLIAYKIATACGLVASEPLDAQLAREPRFGELNYHLGLFALGGQTGRLPDLDAAAGSLRAAYAWRQDWPALTLAIANVAMSAEDFDRAFDFYSRTLALLPNDAEALAGQIRALTYASRHEQAIAVADRLLASGRNPGEAYYWRALNRARLKQDAAAWDDIEQAARSLANADVPKLAGTIAINRRDFAVARQRLELALRRRPGDCETGFYLQSVLAEQRDWSEAARVAADTGACFEQEAASVAEQLSVLQAAVMAPERRDRLIARREQQLAAGARMGATAWFNAAAASYNLARTDDARRFAEKVADDELFGARARSLLDRLP